MNKRKIRRDRDVMLSHVTSRPIKAKTWVCNLQNEAKYSNISYQSGKTRLVE